MYALLLYNLTYASHNFFPFLINESLDVSLDVLRFSLYHVSFPGNNYLAASKELSLPH